MNQNKLTFDTENLGVDWVGFNIEGSIVYEEKLLNSVDLIFTSMSIISENSFIIKKKDGSRFIFLFKTANRKRKGQLNKFCERYLPEKQEYQTKGILKSDMLEQVEKIKKNDNFIIESESKSELKLYDGDDIKPLFNRKNWYPWEEKLYNKIFDKKGEFHKPDPRKIIHIVDLKGDSGKTTYCKYLSLTHSNEIGELGYGTAQQLRTSIFNIGKKKLYFIDLRRSKGYADREEDLLSSLESLK